MNKRLMSVLVFGLIVSAVASLILYRLIAARIVATASQPARTVIVAARALPIGTIIKDTDIRVAAWPEAVPPGASSRPEDVIGRGVVAGIVESEPIVESRLALKGAGGGLAATIPSGMRAVAVAVNEVVGVAGFVLPGMRIDILVSGTPPGASSSGTQTRTLLQNIEVLSAGQNIQKDAEGKPQAVQVVNLLVTPEQAETLSLATQEARIRLVLRNPLDNDISKTSGTAVANLFGAPVKPVTVAATHVRPKQTPVATAPIAEVKTVERVVIPVVVEVFHGTKKSESKFQSESEAKQ